MSRRLNAVTIKARPDTAGHVPSSRSRRHGVTLIELLIVVGLLTILATVSLTSVKGLLRDQKVSQATRLVQQYIETAKIRAITSRRPVAVFLERLSLEGTVDVNGNPVASSGNYSATRLSIGEVFPPYTGDLVGATGSLWDVQFNELTGGNPDCRPADGYADQIRFATGDVVSAFGSSPTNPGIISVGDLIQFEGSSRQYEIENIAFLAGNAEVAVTFFNPPHPGVYNNNMYQSFPTGPAPGTFHPDFSTESPGLPVKQGASLPSLTEPTPAVSTARRVKFRMYRRPTKSLVGSITLPRGICVDMFMSGFGRNGTANDGLTNPFYTIPPDGKVGGGLQRNSFSRVNLVFDATGKPNAMFVDEFLEGTNGIVDNLAQYAIDSKLYLLVGRVDQVSNGPVFVRPADGDETSILPNILDPANSWVVVNPLTGLVTSAPVNAVTDETLATAVNNNDFRYVVNEARSLASVGVSNAGQ